MADQQAEVVIVDSQGAEHVFPPGFDPKRAAAIVHQQATPASPYQPQNVLAEGRQSAASGSEARSAGIAQWFQEKLRPLLEQVAHPQTISDIAALLIPDAGLSATVRAGGRGTAALGRGVEAVATSPAVERISELGSVGELVLKGDLKGAAAAAVAPKAAALTGRALQRTGAAIARAATDAPAVEAATANTPRTVNDAMRAAVEKIQAEKKAAQAANAETATSRAESARGGTPPPADRPPVAASPEPPPSTPAAKPKLTSAEVDLYLKLRAKGKTDAQAREVIAAARQLAGQLPTDAQVRTTVKGRNTTGKWPGREDQ